MQKMKANVDKQGFNLKKSVGSTSKRRPEAVDGRSDLKVAVHTTLGPTIPEEEMMRLRSVGAARFSTSDKDLRVALLKSRFADTIFKAQQEMMKARLDTQGSDLKNSVGSKRRPETVDRLGDSSKKRAKVAVQTSLTPTIRKEEMRSGDAQRISISDKHPCSACPMLKDKALQKMKTVKTPHPKPTILRKREMVNVEAAHVDFKQQRDSDRSAARVALEKMTNTAGIELNLDVQREFDILVGSSSIHY